MNHIAAVLDVLKLNSMIRKALEQLSVLLTKYFHFWKIKSKTNKCYLKKHFQRKNFTSNQKFEEKIKTLFRRKELR